jgi:hypothetical protein
VGSVSTLISDKSSIQHDGFSIRIRDGEALGPRGSAGVTKVSVFMSLSVTVAIFRPIVTVAPF